MLPTPPPVVLASTSPSRMALLRAAGIAFTAVSPPVDESTVQDTDPVRVAEGRAALKAGAVHVPGSIVIGADQVAHLDALRLSKPKDPADHRAQLRLLRGRVHTLSTGVVVRLDAREERFVLQSRLRFREDVTDAELDAYVATGEGSYCAGGYAAEGLGAQLIAEIEGDFFNVLGLPVLHVIGALRRFGWRPSFPHASA